MRSLGWGRAKPSSPNHKCTGFPDCWGLEHSSPICKFQQKLLAVPKYFSSSVVINFPSLRWAFGCSKYTIYLSASLACSCEHATKIQTIGYKVEVSHDSFWEGTLRVRWRASFSHFFLSIPPSCCLEHRCDVWSLTHYAGPIGQRSCPKDSRIEAYKELGPWEPHEAELALCLPTVINVREKSSVVGNSLLL